MCRSSRQTSASDGRGSLPGLMSLRAFFLCILLGLTILLGLAIQLSAAFAQAPLNFPALTTRVVDAANILPPEARARIEAKLSAHEATTSDQLVVATVPSLQGYAVEDYANRLFRAWKLGEAKINNGVLLLVAPTERKIRIEVGYGLEGALTDALSRVIIATAITPRFKAGDFAGGIEAGADGILAILSKDADEWLRRAKPAQETVTLNDIIPIIVFVIFVAIFLSAFFGALRKGGNGAQGTRWHRTQAGNWVVLPGSTGSWGSGGSGWSGGGGWGGGGGGGFSGGGGSSGGGGASGDW